MTKTVVPHDLQAPAGDTPLSYERDPKFHEFLRDRLAAARADHTAGKLQDSDTVFAQLRRRFGWQ